jgi:hypothetical protein
MNLLNASIAFAVILTYAACVQQKEMAGLNKLGPSIQTPFKSVNAEKSSFRFNPEVEQTFKIPTGTTIHIPAQAFVDHTGSVIKTEVTLNYEEYHNAAQVILSGIRMSTFDGNQIQHFESAGMFQIGAESSGNRLDLAAGKSIEVEMASSKDDNDFKNWFLNQETGNWEELGQSIAEINIEKKNIEESLLAIQNSTIDKPEEKSRFLVDFSRLKVQNYTNDALSEVIWVYDPANKSKEFDPEQNLWIFNEKWTQTILKAENDGKHYKATLIGKNKIFETRLKPANDDNKAIKKALIEHQKYIEERNKQIADEIARFEKAQKFQRSFSIAKMGVYNCDRYSRMTNVVAQNVKITVEGNDIARDFMIYQICNNDAVIQIYPNQQIVNYSKFEKVKFVLVDNNEQIAAISSTAFDMLKTNNTATVNLDFKYIPNAAPLTEKGFADVIQNL